MADPDKDADLTPVSQTRKAFEWLRAFGDTHVEKSMMDMAERVQEIAPDCVALSLALTNGELTFTVVADRPGAALMDAVQYLDGGPCVQALRREEIEVTADLPTDEGRWQMFAKAEAMVGISSTLSLPLVREDQTVGGVNLYGSSNDAFDGRHAELAEACGAWVGGVVTNADLGFTSRVRAAATPDRLASRADVDLATGVVAEVQGITPAEAEPKIRGAASRAGVTQAEFARFILDSQAADLD